MDNFLIFLGLQLIRDGMPPPVALVLSVLFFSNGTLCSPFL